MIIHAIHWHVICLQCALDACSLATNYGSGTISCSVSLANDDTTIVHVYRTTHNYMYIRKSTRFLPNEYVERSSHCPIFILKIFFPVRDTCSPVNTFSVTFHIIYSINIYFEIFVKRFQPNYVYA